MERYTRSLFVDEKLRQNYTKDEALVFWRAALKPGSGWIVRKRGRVHTIEARGPTKFKVSDSLSKGVERAEADPGRSPGARCHAS